MLSLRDRLEDLESSGLVETLVECLLLNQLFVGLLTLLVLVENLEPLLQIARVLGKHD